MTAAEAQPDAPKTTVASWDYSLLGSFSLMYNTLAESRLKGTVRDA